MSGNFVCLGPDYRPVRCAERMTSGTKYPKIRLTKRISMIIMITKLAIFVIIGGEALGLRNL